MGTEFWIQNAVTRAIRFRTLPSLAVCLMLTSVHYSPFTEELGQRNSKLDLLKIYDTILLGKYHVTNHQVYHAMRMMLTIVFSKSTRDATTNTVYEITWEPSTGL